jgi:hypothetical protein
MYSAETGWMMPSTTAEYTIGEGAACRSGGDWEKNRARDDPLVSASNSARQATNRRASRAVMVERLELIIDPEASGGVTYSTPSLLAGTAIMVAVIRAKKARTCRIKGGALADGQRSVCLDDLADGDNPIRLRRTVSTSRSSGITDKAA